MAIYAVMKRGAGGDRHRTLDYLSYLIDDYEGSTEELGYLPLPQPGVDAVRSHWASIFNYTR